MCFFHYRQEHSETQMLRKKAKDLDAEYKQLQLQYQEKENRMIAIDNEVDVSNDDYRSVCFFSSWCFIF